MHQFLPKKKILRRVGGLMNQIHHQHQKIIRKMMKLMKKVMVILLKLKQLNLPKLYGLLPLLMNKVVLWIVVLSICVMQHAASNKEIMAAPK